MLLDYVLGGVVTARHPLSISSTRSCAPSGSEELPMTINGWIQIAIYCAVIVIAMTAPLGGYMTRVFNGERTFCRRCCARSSAASRLCGVDENGGAALGRSTPSPC